MTPEQLIGKARLIIALVDKIPATNGESQFLGALSAAREFLRVYAGQESDFYKQVNAFERWGFSSGAKGTREVLLAFIAYVDAGLHGAVSPKRQAEIDVVSDFLAQASTLLGRDDCHPAAAAVLVGATLEEFLRTWVEDAGIDLNGKKPSISTYAQILRADDKVSKQDVKDIESWGGVRNAAAHGTWDEVNDRKRIALMLEGVNLFIRKHS